MTTYLALDLGTTTGFALGTTEAWRPVPDWPEYEVSDRGRVRRVGASKGASVGRVLKPWLTLGYLYVSLWRDNRKTGVAVHRLVAAAFLPPPKPGQTQVAHYDGNRANPAASNLRWATPVENATDRHRHGTHSLGQANPMARLTPSIVRQIRARSDQTHEAIAAKFGVCRQTVGDIRNRKRWGHLE